MIFDVCKNKKFADIFQNFRGGGGGGGGGGRPDYSESP